METKGHTPGPWSYDGHGINCAAPDLLDQIGGPFKGERIFKTSLNYDLGSTNRERAIADSNLVAAAPDLLAALQATVSQLQTVTYAHPEDAINNAVLAQAREAISKAIGA